MEWTNATDATPGTITATPAANSLATEQIGVSTFAVLAGLVLIAFMMIGYGLWQLLKKEKKK